MDRPIVSHGVVCMVVACAVGENVGVAYSRAEVGSCQLHHRVAH